MASLICSILGEKVQKFSKNSGIICKIKPEFSKNM
uniref:Uncharacterized protein n=1 Tax=Rhizophora mucronata TaxID=61149 RepID=A0A2P2R518_RHIMU